LKDWGGSKSTFGNSERAVATRLEVQAAEKAAHPTGSDHFMKVRRATPSSPEGFAAAGAAAGAGGGAAGASFSSAMRTSLVQLESEIE
jgi:hypothetical protein